MGRRAVAHRTIARGAVGRVPIARTIVSDCAEPEAAAPGDRDKTQAYEPTAHEVIV
jgi:hypothetical protein